MADDQDDLAAEWGLALAEQGATPKGGMPDMDMGGAAEPGAEGGDDMASQWAAMIEDGGQFVQAGNKGGAERILNQEEIDSLLGFNLADITLNENSGIRAIIDSAMVSYERLPMLEIVLTGWSG
jgi:flagellar motor switch protein FliM